MMVQGRCAYSALPRGRIGARGARACVRVLAPAHAILPTLPPPHPPRVDTLTPRPAQPSPTTHPLGPAPWPFTTHTTTRPAAHTTPDTSCCPPNRAAYCCPLAPHELLPNQPQPARRACRPPHLSPRQVGVVGRTGSGKSSLLMAIYRMFELAKGRIVIDGVDIATLPLDRLRRGAWGCGWGWGVRRAGARLRGWGRRAAAQPAAVARGVAALCAPCPARSACVCVCAHNAAHFLPAPCQVGAVCVVCRHACLVPSSSSSKRTVPGLAPAWPTPPPPSPSWTSLGRGACPGGGEGCCTHMCSSSHADPGP